MDSRIWTILFVLLLMMGTFAGGLRIGHGLVLYQLKRDTDGLTCFNAEHTAQIMMYQDSLKMKNPVADGFVVRVDNFTFTKKE